MKVGRLHRVLRLVTLLQGGTAMTAAMLAEEMGVSRRTLFRDLKTIHIAGIPYEFDNDHGYRIPSGFFLPPLNLRVTEAMGLMVMAKAAQDRRDQPMLRPAVEAVRKLMTMLPGDLRDICGQMMRRVTVRPGASSAVNGDEAHFAAMQQAIDQKRVVSMTYHSLFDRGVIDLCLHPYHLHYAVRAWYVIGRSEVHRQVRTFKLSRVRRMDLLARRYKLAKPFDIDRHLGLCWNMIPEGKVHAIELEFDAKVAVNVAEVRWHSTQRHQFLPDGRLRVHFEVDGLNEITWWLLGYGDQVVVRKPVALARRLAEVYRSALRRLDGGAAPAEGAP
jgi:proteasome accessory factor B